jgi:hypothetical protein
MDAPMLFRRWLQPAASLAAIAGGFVLYIAAKEATIPVLAAWIDAWLG